jgi:hypothetical protein
LRVRADSVSDPAIFAVHRDPAPTAPASAETAVAPPEGMPATMASAGEILVKDPGPPEPAGEILVKGNGPSEPEGEVLVKSAASTAEDSITLASDAEKVPEIENRFAADVPVEEPITRVRGRTEKAEPGLTLVKGSASEEDEAETRISSSPKEKEKIERFRAGEQEKDETIATFSAEKAPTPAALRLTQRLQQAKGKKEEEIRFRQDKEEVIAELKTVVLSSKISEKIVELSARAKKEEEPSLRSSLRGQIRNLRGNLDQLEAGEAIEETDEINAHEEEREFRAQLESDEGSAPIQSIQKHLERQTKVKDLAISAAEEQEREELTLSRSATSRDLPATVSRLAAYLGHSLGYTDVDFLADLACGVVIHFAKKEGENVNEAELPPLAKFIISPDDSYDSVAEDSQDILTFLDAYIDDWECDRSQKDLVKKVFDRTVKEFIGKEEGPSPYSLSKWSSFLEHGPTMDSHSIVTRAAAKGVKSARSAIV